MVNIIKILSILLLFTFPLWVFIFIKYIGYQKSTYRKETDQPFFKVLRDKGMLGEYYTTQVLDKIKGYKKYLVNSYIPNGKGGTTEIDIIFIHETGIYVIESKNYSGWIFGTEKDKNWCQSLSNGQKEFFYNPIKQNASHIRNLQNVLDFVPKDVFKSIIVFSERCELKKVTVESDTVFVIKRNELINIINNEISNAKTTLTKEEVDKIYNTLKPYCQVANEVKEKHIEQIEKYKGKQGK